MSATRTRFVRAASLGGALALASAGLVGSVGLATVSDGGVAGADTPSFTASCTIAGTATALTAVVTGAISPSKVGPGSGFGLSGLGLKSNLSVATQNLIPGDTFSGSFTGTITSTGASPASLPVVFHIPSTKVPAHPTVPLPLTAPGTLSGSFTAASSGASSVSASFGTSGSLDAAINGADVGAGPCHQPAERIASAPIAQPAGTIKTVLPNAGPLAGGTTVKIIGAFLSNPKSVTFGSKPAASFHGLTADSVEAVSPAGSAGTVGVSVSTSAGPSTSGSFTYTNGPIVTGLRPSTGSPSGGTSVIITGQQLAGATAVHFGSKAASFRVASSTSIAATSPSGSGVVDVTVTGPAGTSVTSSQDRFSYRSGYWFTASDGGVFAFGHAPFEGSAGNITLNQPIVGMAATPDGYGYWLVASDGGIFAYGDAGFHGSLGATPLRGAVVGGISAPDGGGYSMTTSDGGLFNFGDAGFFGSASGLILNQPIVGVASSPDGGGYWQVAADGGIFNYGSAAFYGSTGGITLNKPIVGIAAAGG